MRVWFLRPNGTACYVSLSPESPKRALLMARRLMRRALNGNRAKPIAFAIEAI